MNDDIQTPARDAHIIVRRSRYGYGETVTRLRETIAAAGNTIFAAIDQADAAAKAGLSLRPTTLIVFGNPKAGTLLMDAMPLFALELPLKLIVWEQDGVHVAYTPAGVLAQRYKLTEHDALIETIDRSLTNLIASVSEE